MAAISDFRSKRFYHFLIYKSSWYFLPSFESIGLSVQEKKRKIDFQNSGNGGHLWFLIGTIFVFFYTQVTLMLPIKFKISWPFSSGEEAKNRFSRWQPWRPCWFRIGKISAIFELQVTLMLSLTFHVHIGFSFQEKKRKVDFQDGGHLGFPSEQIYYFSMPRHFQWGHIVSPLSYVCPTRPSVPSVPVRNTFGFRAISFERTGVLNWKFIHMYIIIKCRSSLI